MAEERLQRLDPNASLLTPEAKEDLNTALHNLDVLQKQVEKAIRMGITPDVSLEAIEADRKRIRQILQNA